MLLIPSNAAPPSFVRSLASPSRSFSVKTAVSRSGNAWWAPPASPCCRRCASCARPRGLAFLQTPAVPPKAAEFDRVTFQYAATGPADDRNAAPQAEASPAPSRLPTSRILAATRATRQTGCWLRTAEQQMNGPGTGWPRAACATAPIGLARNRLTAPGHAATVAGIEAGPRQPRASGAGVVVLLGVRPRLGRAFRLSIPPMARTCSKGGAARRHNGEPLGLTACAGQGVLPACVPAPRPIRGRRRAGLCYLWSQARQREILKDANRFHGELHDRYLPFA